MRTSRVIDRASFFVPGPPVPKARARVTKQGSYTPSKTRNYERATEGKSGVEVSEPLPLK